MNSDLIHAILFDADGVVVNPMMQFSRHLSQVYGISQERTRDFFHGVFNQCLLGQARLENVLPPFLSEWSWSASLDEFITTWMREDHHVDDRLVQSILSLRKNGYLCCLATSQECHRAKYMRHEMGFDQLFDRLFFSCELGCMKPNPEFSAKIEQQLGITGKAILFWDDSQLNVDAAREWGWNAQLYTSFDDFEERISGILGSQLGI